MMHIPAARAFRAARLGLLGLALAGLTLACGTSAPPGSFGAEATAVPAATAAPAATGIPAATAVPAATGIPAATAVPATTAVPPARLPAAGAQVGARVPDFTLKLAGGAQITSQELQVQHRPAFLFFFASW